jgi:hypothetical protein
MKHPPPDIRGDYLLRAGDPQFFTSIANIVVGRIIVRFDESYRKAARFAG